VSANACWFDGSTKAAAVAAVDFEIHIPHAQALVYVRVLQMMKQWTLMVESLLCMRERM
jgi:hypothetical protein